MLTGYDIVYFGDNWDGVLRNRQQLMSIFARHNKVLFIERGNSLQTTISLLKKKQLHLTDLFRPLVRQISDNLFVFHEPVWAPASEKFLLGHLTGLLRHLSLRYAMRRLAIKQPIVWYYHPNWLDFIDGVPSSRLRLYHVVDEYTSFQDKTAAMKQHIEARERELSQQVDAVIVVSEKLYESKAPLHPNTYIVPNGVNYQAYSEALARPELPAEMAAVKAPILGYSGLIGDKLELDMLKDLALKQPDWSFVFLGPVNANQKQATWQSLCAMPNVFHFGPVDWSEVPNYVKGFDVGLMPYVQNRNSDNISPLKLYDYLAAGLPVVSLDIPAARKFKDHIYLAAHPEDFESAVCQALGQTSPEQQQARRAVAAQHTWEARVETLSDLILTQLTIKSEQNGLKKCKGEKSNASS
ncbi:MAG: glycosyltransferase [Anaerolineae bacterium]|nr:glycosyltransferase [Anaerolineae bacterium]